MPPRPAFEYSSLFPHAGLAESIGGGHHPWLYEPELFSHTVATFLDLEASIAIPPVFTWQPPEDLEG